MINERVVPEIRRLKEYEFREANKREFFVDYIKQSLESVLLSQPSFSSQEREYTTNVAYGRSLAYQTLQMQERSPVEPMSVLYKCSMCSHQWR